MATFPNDFTAVTPANNDNLLVSDTSDGGINKKATAGQVVVAGLSSGNTDLLPEGVTNKYLTVGERTKIQSIEFGSQVNQVNKVNLQQGNVVLTQDDILNGTSFVQTENNFTDTAVGELSTATNHVNDMNNPHGTTKVHVGLGNVVNEQQLSTTAGNFTALDEKSDVQQHLDDMYVLQDSSDGDIIKKVSNRTELIWKAGLLQVRGPSINYYKFTFTSSTTYNISSVVFFGGNLYICDVSHQSSGSFVTDLGLGYWTLVGSGGGGGGNAIYSGTSAPVSAGITAGDLFVDYVGQDLYIWNGSSWILFASGGPVSGITFATVPTTGARIIFSVGVGGDTIDESTLIYDAMTDTFTFSGSNIVYDGVDTTYQGANVVNLADGSSITNNIDGDVNNNYGANYTENNDYVAGATINNDGEVNNNYASTYVENNDYVEGATINNAGEVNIVNTDYIENIAGGTYNYGDTVTNNFAGPLNITNINQILGTDIFVGDGVTTVRGPLPGRVPGSTVVLTNTTTGAVLVEGVDYTIDPLTGVITYTPAIPLGQSVEGIVVLENSISNLNVTNLNVSNIDLGGVLLKKGITTTMDTNTLVVVEVDCTETTIISWTSLTAPVGFIEIIPGAGSFTINSSATETGLIFNYILF